MTDLLKDYPIILTQAVQWGDMDAFGHVNNTVNFRYFEDVRIAYFEKLQALQRMAESQIGPIMANAYCDFLAPLHHPDTISIGCKVSDVQTKKFSMYFAVFSHTLNTLTAKGHGLIVYFDYATKKSCNIPEPIKTSIADIENS